MKQIKKISAIVLLGSTLTLVSPVMAFGGFSLPSVPGLGGGSSSQSSNFDTQVFSKQANAVISDLATSIVLFGKSAGYEFDKASEDKMSECSSKPKTCTDSLNTITSSAPSMIKKIEEMQKDGHEMDAKAKKEFSKAWGYVGRAVVKGAILAPQLANASEGIKDKMKSNPFGSLGELKDLLTVVSKLPKALSLAGDLIGVASSYGEKSGIEETKDVDPT